ncbi:MAG: hypothetical protein M1113_01905 [Candidatus Thermoplasmatota archaeon]|nr:hypothetical protein [Candidatus Thermoplasmatota archaeon]
MLFSHIAYLFLALVYYRIGGITFLASIIDSMKNIRITFLIRNKEVRKSVISQNEHGINAMKILRMKM